jgi:parallel beta-helix repeat protein
MKARSGSPVAVIRPLLLVVTALGSLVVGAAGAQAATLAVDDDAMQCPNAGYTSIQAAVNDAQTGDMIRVCPGVYHESVTIDKPLRLEGDPDAVAALDCFAPELGAADPTQQAIVDGTGSSAQQLFDLEANDIVLRGFVLQGASSDPSQPYPQWRRAINTSDQYSGYRINHNLIRSNTVGIRFGSEGTQRSRVNDNCVRENLFGLGADDRNLVNATVDQNDTFMNEMVAIAPDRPLKLQNVTFANNLSQQDGGGYAVANSTASRIVDNEVTNTVHTAITILGGNQDLLVAGNRVLRDGAAGIFAPGTLTESLITDNTAMANRGTGISLSNGSGNDVTDNQSSENGASGIFLGASFTGSQVSDNEANDNGRNGIAAALGAIGNRFENNSMHGNGNVNPSSFFDANDANIPPNVSGNNFWIDNDCVTDNVGGAICGAQ